MLRCVLLIALLFQGKPPGAGHWEGTLELPDRELKLAVDLAQDEKGEWIGDLDIPDMKVLDVPLSKIEVKATSVSFDLPGIPGDPRFQGGISPDGKTIKGDLSQGGGTFPFRLQWVSEPSVKLPEKSTPISKEAEGTWEGSLTAPDGKVLRIRVKLSNGPDGVAAGTFNSLDQGGQELPLSSIIQKGSSLKFSLKIAGAMFEGELKGDELSGKFNQSGFSMPIALKRLPPPAPAK